MLVPPESSSAVLVDAVDAVFSHTGIISLNLAVNGQWYNSEVFPRACLAGVKVGQVQLCQAVSNTVRLRSCEMGFP